MTNAPLARLHVRDEEGQVTTLSLDEIEGDVISIGRDFDNTVQLPDITVSRFHARMVKAKTKDRYLLEDLKSYNGVLVNGDPVTGPLEVGVGDRIVVGGFMLWFEGADGRGSFDCPTVRIEPPKKGV